MPCLAVPTRAGPFAVRAGYDVRARAHMQSTESSARQRPVVGSTVGRLPFTVCLPGSIYLLVVLWLGLFAGHQPISVHMHMHARVHATCLLTFLPFSLSLGDDSERYDGLRALESAVVSDVTETEGQAG